jgi:hypothetical protein
MAFDARVPGRRVAVASSLVCLALMAACGSSASSASSGAETTGAPTVPATTSPPAGAPHQLPGSCGEIPTSLIDPYIGGVANIQSLGAASHGVSCEFANADASKILVLTMGQGATAAAFAASEAIAAQGGRNVTPVSGLGASAFSISKGGVPAGMEVLSAQGQIFSVTANLSFDQDEALIKQLMLRY